ncbi:MAG: DUF3467 domain-containing protein [Nanoarchaeota archaeon]|nr:DUF3467 domain-containing protein [Nanoarchaeota archaeon]
MEEEKKLNIHIDEGDTFFTNEVSVNFNPMQFFIDFKNVAPRVDIRSKEGEVFINIKHNVITFDPHHGKQILELLAKAMENYEKEFGPIEKPKAIDALEKKMKKGTKEKAVEKAPIYFG